MNLLLDLIIEKIQHAEQQQITFAEFMQLALYAPDRGYYMRGENVLGTEGDYVTAPIISPIFSQCLARQCQQIFAQSSGINHILEIGAGTGVMAADVLLNLETMESLPETYGIIEISPGLKQKQLQMLTERCSHLLPKIQWHTIFPENFCGIVIANEVLDAMPVHRCSITAEGLQEYYVKFDPTRGHGGPPLRWKLGFVSDERLISQIEILQTELLEKLPENYVIEINLFQQDWITTLAKSLKQGIVLLFDYGYSQREYYHPQRTQGTLTCFYQHQQHADPLIHVGLQDITAHVNFTAIAKTAVLSDLSVMGYTTQAAFLLANGALVQHDGVDVEEQYKIAQQLKKLLLPTEMGELIKVMALGKKLNISLPEFYDQDRRRGL